MSNLQEYFRALTLARERRLQKRTTPSSLTLVDLGGTDGGIILNISETGMAVAVADRFTVGKYLPCIRFQLPGSSQSIEIPAQVVWLAESKKGAGVRFVELTADARNQIANWIASEKSVSEIEHLPLQQPIIAKRTTAVDEIKPQQSPLPTPVSSNTDPGVSILRFAAKISTGDVPQTFSLPQGQTASELVAPGASHTPVIFDVSALHVAALVFSFAVIGLIIGIAATKTSVDVLASLGRVPFGKHVRLRSTRDSKPSVKMPSTDSNSSTKPVPKPSANPAARSNRNALTGRSARSTPLPARALHAPSAVVAVGPTRSGPRNRALLATKPAWAAKPSQPTANLEHTYPAVAVGPGGTVSGSPDSPTAKPAMPAVPNPPPPAYLVTVPSKGSKPLPLVFPQKQIASSSSFSIITQLSILISPEPGPAVTHQPARLQAGNLVSYVEPRQPRAGDRYRSTETVKVRATIGQQGQVMDIRPVSGPIFLLSSAMSAIRQWRYQPTLLNERPVQAQQDVTIEFRLPP